MSGEGMGLWTPARWRENREYQMTKRKTWQDTRRKWGEIENQQDFQLLAKAWKDAYDIGFKEIDDGNTAEI